MSQQQEPAPPPSTPVSAEEEISLAPAGSGVAAATATATTAAASAPPAVPPSAQRERGFHIEIETNEASPAFAKIRDSNGRLCWKITFEDPKKLPQYMKLVLYAPEFANTNVQQVQAGLVRFVYNDRKRESSLENYTGQVLLNLTDRTLCRYACTLVADFFRYRAFEQVSGANQSGVRKVRMFAFSCHQDTAVYKSPPIFVSNLTKSGKNGLGAAEDAAPFSSGNMQGLLDLYDRYVPAPKHRNPSGDRFLLPQNLSAQLVGRGLTNPGLMFSNIPGVSSMPPIPNPSFDRNDLLSYMLLPSASSLQAQQQQQQQQQQQAQNSAGQSQQLNYYMIDNQLFLGAPMGPAMTLGTSMSNQPNFLTPAQVHAQALGHPSQLQQAQLLAQAQRFGAQNSMPLQSHQALSQAFSQAQMAQAQMARLQHGSGQLNPGALLHLSGNFRPVQVLTSSGPVVSHQHQQQHHQQQQPQSQIQQQPLTAQSQQQLPPQQGIASSISSEGQNESLVDSSHLNAHSTTTSNSTDPLCTSSSLIQVSVPPCFPLLPSMAHSLSEPPSLINTTTALDWPVAAETKPDIPGSDQECSRKRASAASDRDLAANSDTQAPNEPDNDEVGHPSRKARVESS